MTKDKEFLKKLKEIFYQEVKSDFSNIISNHERGDLIKVYESAHKVKGASYIIEEEEISYVCQNIEKNKLTGDELKQAIQNLYTAINSFCEREGYEKFTQDMDLK